MSAAKPGGMRVWVKSMKTALTRQRWFYRLLFRSRAMLYAACEVLSLAASRLSGRRILIGVHTLPSPELSGGMKYRLAACLRFKNEARYLPEWIDFHHLAGFEHFYLYNNNSTDNFLDVLEPYIEQGVLTVHDWPAVPASPGADLHCIENYRDQAKWIAFLDADEFLFAGDGADLKEVLSDFEPSPAVAVNWIYFGSNGHEQRPQGSVIENYTRRAAAPNRHVKCIVNPRKAIRYGNSHHWFYSGGQLAVNEAHLPVYGSFHEPATVERLRIHHYYSKSREDFLAKAAMKTWVDREGASFPSRTAEAWNLVANANNEIEDQSACSVLAGFKTQQYAA